MLQNKYTLQFKYSSTDKTVLYSFKNFIVKTLSKFKIKFKLFILPKKLKKIILLKSPHVYKKAKEQFGQHKYSFCLKLKPKMVIIKLLTRWSPTNIKTKITLASV